LKLLETF